MSKVHGWRNQCFWSAKFSVLWHFARFVILWIFHFHHFRLLPGLLYPWVVNLFAPVSWCKFLFLIILALSKFCCKYMDNVRVCSRKIRILCVISLHYSLSLSFSLPFLCLFHYRSLCFSVSLFLSLCVSLSWSLYLILPVFMSLSLCLSLTFSVSLSLSFSLTLSISLFHSLCPYLKGLYIPSIIPFFYLSGVWIYPLYTCRLRQFHFVIPAWFVLSD